MPWLDGQSYEVGKLFEIVGQNVMQTCENRVIEDKL